MRKGELLNLKWEHVDLKNGFIFVRKTKNDKVKKIPIDENLIEQLKNFRNGGAVSGDYVFLNQYGRPWKSIREGFMNSCRRAGIKNFRFHDLRHTGASLLANEGCDILKLQNILGHKTMAMTQRYSHLMPSSYEQIRDVQKKAMGNLQPQKQPQLVILVKMLKKKASI